MRGLRRGGGVHGGHETFLKAKLIHDHFHNWRQTIRGATCVADHGVARGIVLLMIDLVDKRWNFLLTFRWRGNQNALGASGNVGFGGLEIREAAGALKNIRATKILPWKFGRLALAQCACGHASHGKRFTRRLYFMLKATVVGVVLQEIRQVVSRHQIIHANNFKTAALNRRAIDQATNATETVDTNSNCHG